MLNKNQLNFNKHAYHYNTATPIQAETVKTLASLICSHFSPIAQSTWLDIGCGTGRLSQEVLTNRCNINGLTWYGLDNSPNMLRIFEQNLADFQAKNPEFLSQTRLADMQTIPLPDNSVHQVISSFALHWVGEGSIGNMVAELGRVLAPNGQIHVAIPVAGSLSELHERCPNLPIYPFASAENWLENFDRLIRLQGGTWLYKKHQCFSHTYPNIRTLLKQLKQMGGTVSLANRDNFSGIKNLRQCLREEKAIALDYQVLLMGVQLAT